MTYINAKDRPAVEDSFFVQQLCKEDLNTSLEKDSGCSYVLRKKKKKESLLEKITIAAVFIHIHVIFLLPDD